MDRYSGNEPADSLFQDEKFGNTEPIVSDAALHVPLTVPP